MVVKKGEFNNKHNNFFGSVTGAYTAITEKEVEKTTYNVKAIIRDMMLAYEDDIIPLHKDTDGKILFNIWPGLPEMPEELEITCRFSKPNRSEVSIYISNDLVPSKIKEGGDIWFVFFRKNDNQPWFGYMKRDKWEYFFGQKNIEDLFKEKNENLMQGSNKIIYGAPGTGKSYKLWERYQKNKPKERTIRVTFHPEYTYHDFIGSYKPVPLYEGETKLKDANGDNADVEGKPVIDYQFVPGPFTKLLIRAYNDEDNMYTLIIEELNRANAPAVFGDFFQLLERDETGESEYEVEPSPELLKYLKRKIDNDKININNDKININNDKIKLPCNLNIVATMNSADQGVFAMDSAFKRRWDFEYNPIQFDDIEHAEEKVKYNNGNVSWKSFVEDINKKLKDIEVNEDRHIGPYFLKSGEPSDSSKIANKLLIYLWDDVVRHHRNKFFDNDIKTFGELIDKYNKGKEIFRFNIDTVDNENSENPEENIDEGK